jgi:UPF0716 family protein affecting phage T7 exclusion
MLTLVKRVARVTASAILILAGLVLAVPGIPGPGLRVILVGLLVILPESRWLRKRYVHFKRRHPRVFHAIEEYRKRRRRRVKRKLVARQPRR